PRGTPACPHTRARTAFSHHPAHIGITRSNNPQARTITTSSTQTFPDRLTNVSLRWLSAVARPPVWLLRLRRRNVLLDGGCPVTAAGSGAGTAAAGASGLCGLGVVVAGRVSAGGFPVVGDGGHQLVGAAEPVEGRAQAGEVVHER